MHTETSYRERLLAAYEGELSGIGYFAGLAAQFPDSGHQRKLKTLAALEGQTAKALEPLLARHRLVSRGFEELAQQGKDQAAAEDTSSWTALMAYIVKEFPVYIREFEELLGLAPENEKAIVRQVLEHELVIVDLAQRELRGEGEDALAVVTRHLQRYAR